VGGSPESVVRAARHGFALMLAIIGGPPDRFAPFAQLFREALDRFGRPPLPVGVHSPGHVAATDEQAMDEMWPHYLDVVGRVGRIRGWAPPTKDQFVREAGPHGAWYIGAPETVANKIARNLPALGATRFDLKYGMAGLPHDAVMTNIELYGTQVVPRVRALLAETEGASET
jgi:alkanesulfonate monooxygenase SsuD/methylene tetrahydromethanopterin reductase-like flavin-dependent oxidoreductase (luciferase family)